MTGPRWRRVAVWSAAITTAVIIALSSVLWFLVWTEPGARLVVSVARSRLPDGTTIGQVRGRLRGPLTLFDVRYQGDAGIVKLDTVIVDWRLGALLRRQLDLAGVQLNGVDVQVAAPGETERPSEPIPLPDVHLPFRIKLERAVTRRVAISLPDVDSIYRVDSIVTTDAEFRDRLRVGRIELLAPAAHAALGFWLEPLGVYPLEASFTWSAPVRGVTVAGNGTARGNLDSLELSHELTAPASMQLNATLRDVRGELTFAAMLNFVEFNTWDLDTTLVPAQVSGRVAVAGAPSRFTADGVLAVTETRLGQIDVRLHAAIEDTVIQLDSISVRSPNRSGGIGLTGLLTRQAHGIDADITAHWQDLSWPLEGPPRLLSRGRGRLQLAGQRLGFDIVTALDRIGVPTGEFRLRGNGDRQQLNFAGSGEVLGGFVTADGTVAWRPEVTWNVGMNASGLDLTPFVTDSTLVPQEVTLSAQTTGGVRQDTIAGHIMVDSARAIVRDIPLVAAVTGQFGPSALSFDTATVRLLEGTIVGSGGVTWAPDISWDIALAATGLEPSTLFPNPADWPGTLHARGATTGQLSGNAPDITVRIDTVHGTMRQEVVAANATVLYGHDALRIPEASLRWGSLRFAASGEVSEQLEGRIELDAPDLAAPLPDAGGALSLHLEFAGTRSAPTITGFLSGDSLRFRDMRISELEATTDLQLASSGVFDLTLVGRELVAGERSLERGSVTVSGTREQHEFAIELTGPALDLRLDGSGALETDRWRANLTRLELNEERAGTWTLRSPVPLEVSRNDAMLEELCIDGDGAACMSGVWQRNGLGNATIDIDQLSLSRVAAYVAPDLDVQGNLDLIGQLRTADDGTMDGRLDIALGPGTFAHRERANAPRIAFEPSTLNAEIGASGVEMAWSTLLRALDHDSGAVSVDGSLGLPEYRRLTDSLPSQPIRGRLRAVAEDFSALEALFPTVVEPRGALRLEVDVDGSLAQPRVRGSGEVTGVRADIPSLGLALRDGELTATGDDQGVTFRGQISSGAGVLRVTGRSSGQLAADTVLLMQLGGTDVLAAATSEVQLRASPDLRVRAGRSWVEVEGEVTIPSASVELREIPAVAVPLSRDLVYVDDTVSTDVAGWELWSRVRVVLGDSVSFRGFGFTAHPRGNILVIDEPGQVTTGTGRLSLDGGRYKGYGQDLTVESGRVVFAGGPIDNPGLDVRAVRRARDGTLAGLDIRGTLREPEVTIFSEPPMLQSEALAYLILGRPLNEASSAEGSRLTGAARSLGLRGGNLLAQRIATRLGLDEARVEAEDSWQAASFLAGKYLSPRLYVAYSLGLFESSSVFRVRYLLSSKWTLQAETGDGTATDILYRIERGR